MKSAENSTSCGTPGIDLAPITALGVEWTVRVTDHCLTRHRERFPDIAIGDAPLHFLKALLSARVILGEVRGDPDTFFLWHQATNRLFVMVGFLGIVRTVYDSRESAWFRPFITRDWPIFAAAFQVTVDPRHLLTPKRRHFGSAEKNRQRYEDQYRRWVEGETG